MIFSTVVVSFTRQQAAAFTAGTPMPLTDAARLREALVAEASALSGLRHTNLVAFYGVVLNDSECPEWFVFEFADGGNLLQFEQAALASGAELDADLLLSFTKALFRALTYLHSKSPPIVHARVNPSSCLLFKSYGGGLTLKLLMLADHEPSAAAFDDARFVAPDAATSQRLLPAADVFSAGVTLLDAARALLRLPVGLGGSAHSFMEPTLTALTAACAPLAAVLRGCTALAVDTRSSSMLALSTAEAIVVATSPSRARAALRVSCPYFALCARFVRSLGLPDDFFFWDDGPSRCFCADCVATRAEPRVSSRGIPAAKLVQPFGWARVGLAVGGTQATAVGAFTNWHVAYHGTRLSSLRGILRTGCLVKAGDVVLDGHRIGIRDGHIPEPILRLNEHTGEQERFNPNQIFVSPVIEYSASECYAASERYGRATTAVCTGRV